MIIGILILGLILRLVNFNQSLWLDEAVQAITSQGSFAGIFTELQGDFHPPLYHLLTWLWVHLFGSSEVVLRLPSVLFGIATVFVVYKLMVHINRQSAIIVALLMSTAPFHIYYSQEARMYAMTTFFAALSMYFFVRLISCQKKNNTRPLKIGYVLATVLLLYSDYFGLFVLLAQAIAAPFLILQFLCLLFFLPWLPMFLTQIQVGRQAIQALPEWGKLVNVNFTKALPLTFIKFSIGRITIFNKKLYAVIAGVLFLAYGVIIARGFFQKRKLTIDKRQLTILLWLVVPILSAWLISIFIPNYQPFRLLLVLPAFYLLLSLGITRFSNSGLRQILIFFILAVNLISLAVFYTNPYFHREDWRGVVSYIEKQEIANSVALLPSLSSHWPYTYYAKNKIPLAMGTSSQNLVDRNKIFYICYLVPLFDPDEKISFWLTDNNFVKIKEVNFNQIPLWVYQKQ
ncbi:MAG TPA: glycosyltransferase family 39 protein [Nevskiaceae bacterium]|nr:glycosyltransferase family 39 protein [Nevskiaceae bacterium]